ncbi:hypothetical protein RFI_15122 [Reticulomyxa filosa]|uniref:Uncharacterized protein n=1 Tax=Reticulomyxa filosa TaxID=46433 RepID=X6N726_RETFI|nr:hypothetical protein RFI_15122 [Reticulomyxa filosa]|eukprot:ETO22080.1 hypothetical protein RFI_15122 [Reticulomyxa filosa]
MTTILSKEKETSIQLLEGKEIKIITQHWIRILNINLGWINDFNKLIVNYATTVFIIDTFRSSSNLIKTFIGHTNNVCSIDYSTFDGSQYLCSGSWDCTVRVWDVETAEQIRLFNGHSSQIICVKFSPYHGMDNRSLTICSSSDDKTIRFWDFKTAKEFQVLNEHTDSVCGIEFSSFNNGRYLCSGSYDDTIRLWDVETFKTLHIFEHGDTVRCVEFSPLQSNSKDKNNSIGVIGGNGYTICSGTNNGVIHLWDVETTKQLILFDAHKSWIRSIKYSPYEANVICSGSDDKTVRLWDIRSNKEINVFKEHTNDVKAAEFSPFVSNNNSHSDGKSITNANIICSGSSDNTIRFWDIRANKQVHLIKGNDHEDNGICSLTFLALKNKAKDNCACRVSLCYGSYKGPIRVWR